MSNMATQSARTYVCEDCGGTFVDGDRPDDEVQAEAVKNFGKPGDHPDMAVVCDDCYREIMRRIQG